ncbi:class I SAM-dependent methyltransferase [Paraburkholderia hayleyella]|uniref:class I SAM-dependent methyltransferase n=1 Tax=Paraburkholderia hayleyella TaxID=2152889 RepID=UPI001291CD96|nr:class I SAM-dependent methyltransferase [Paraburkholderia hayleyella]
MTQNIYDDPAFFSGYSKLKRSIEGLAGAAEWPALRAMLPALQGLKIVDLGCGYGWFCRWAQEQSAMSILGLDVSEKMLKRAREFSVKSDNSNKLANSNSSAMTAITYTRADLEEFELSPGHFDLAYSSLAFHYIKDLPRLFSTLHQALVPGASLVFSIEHPVYMAPIHPEWLIDAQGCKSWPVNSYQREGPRVTNWLADGVIKHHRTIGTLLNHLIDAGFTLTRIHEWGPTEAQLTARPELAEECERPMMLLVSARRA